MSEVQLESDLRHAGDLPRVEELIHPRHLEDVPVRSQSLACGGDRRESCVLPRSLA